MNSRERFEAHVESELGDIAVMDAGRYISPKIQNYWLTWQAAERDMLERCVAVCESRITPCTGSNAILMGAANEMKELLNEQH